MDNLENILWIPAILSGVGVTAAIVINIVRGCKLNKRIGNQHKAVLNSMSNSYNTLSQLNNSIKKKYKL